MIEKNKVILSIVVLLSTYSYSANKNKITLKVEYNCEKSLEGNPIVWMNRDSSNSTINVPLDMLLYFLNISSSMISKLDIDSALVGKESTLKEKYLFLEKFLAISEHRKSNNLRTNKVIREFIINIIKRDNFSLAAFSKQWVETNKIKRLKSLDITELDSLKVDLMMLLKSFAGGVNITKPFNSVITNNIFTQPFDTKNLNANILSSSLTYLIKIIKATAIDGNWKIGVDNELKLSINNFINKFFIEKESKGANTTTSILAMNTKRALAREWILHQYSILSLLTSDIASMRNIVKVKNEDNVILFSLVDANGSLINYVKDYNTLDIQSLNMIDEFIKTPFDMSAMEFYDQYIANYNYDLVPANKILNFTLQNTPNPEELQSMLAITNYASASLLGRLKYDYVEDNIIQKIDSNSFNMIDILNSFLKLYKPKLNLIKYDQPYYYLLPVIMQNLWNELTVLDPGIINTKPLFSFYVIQKNNTKFAPYHNLRLNKLFTGLNSFNKDISLRILSGAHESKLTDVMHTTKQEVAIGHFREINSLKNANRYFLITKFNPSTRAISFYDMLSPRTLYTDVLDVNDSLIYNGSKITLYGLLNISYAHKNPLSGIADLLD